MARDCRKLREILLGGRGPQQTIVLVKNLDAEEVGLDILTPALDVCEWSTSRPGRLNRMKETR